MSWPLSWKESHLSIRPGRNIERKKGRTPEYPTFLDEPGSYAASFAAAAAFCALIHWAASVRARFSNAMSVNPKEFVDCGLSSPSR